MSISPENYKDYIDDLVKYRRQIDTENARKKTAQNHSQLFEKAPHLIDELALENDLSLHSQYVTEYQNYQELNNNLNQIESWIDTDFHHAVDIYKNEFSLTAQKQVLQEINLTNYEQANQHLEKVIQNIFKRRKKTAHKVFWSCGVLLPIIIFSIVFYNLPTKFLYIHTPIAVLLSVFGLTLVAVFSTVIIDTSKSIVINAIGLCFFAGVPAYVYSHVALDSNIELTTANIFGFYLLVIYMVISTLLYITYLTKEKE